jgi:endonuclease YncB( thermonuclease family)
VGNILRFKKHRQPKPWRSMRSHWNHWLFCVFPQMRLIVLVGLFGVLCLNIPDKFPNYGARKRPYHGHATSGVISCFRPRVIDGDTFTCNSTRIRLASIDAPEMPGHCRPGRSCTAGDPIASRDYLRSISSGQVTCRPIETDSYGRTVALCDASGVDLSCAMVASNHAVQRYGSLNCAN